MICNNLYRKILKQNIDAVGGQNSFSCLMKNTGQEQNRIYLTTAQKTYVVARIKKLNEPVVSA